MTNLCTVPPCELTENGGCEHTCTNEGDTAKCSCNEFYKLGEDGKTCEKGAILAVIESFKNEH